MITPPDLGVFWVFFFGPVPDSPGLALLGSLAEVEDKMLSIVADSSYTCDPVCLFAVVCLRFCDSRHVLHSAELGFLN